MLPANLPDDINVELLYMYYPQGSCKASFKGLHKRNAYSDIIDIEERGNNLMLVSIGRNSLYNALPEFMFHPIDRFNELPRLEEKERFAQEYEMQENEKENAYRFFAPIDTILLQLRISIREQLAQYSETNKALIDIIADSLTESQRNNRFIRQVLPFLPSCKHIRGNMTLMTFMLRKVLKEEHLTISPHKRGLEYTDENPRYDYTLGASIDACYAGNTFEEKVTVYDIHYWSDEECNANFLSFIDEIEELRRFIQDYFMSIDETLSFNIWHNATPLRLNDEIIHNYLNYNTNI